MYALQSKRSTLFGLLALGMWTFEPLLISEVNGLPIFELMAILFFSSFIFTSIRITYRRKWHRVMNHSWKVYVLGMIGICISDTAYVCGTQYAPVAHVDLIDYLGPCWAIIFTGLLPREKLSWHHVIGALLGFAGIFILMRQQILTHGFQIEYILGYGLGMVGALVWGGYAAFSRHHQSLPTEMIGIYCGLGALICILLSLHQEQFVMPSLYEGGLAVLSGCTVAGAAYQFWDYGIKKGNVYLLNALTYLVRILALCLLVLFGKEPFTLTLVAACVLSSVGVLICSLNANTFYRVFSRFEFARLRAALRPAAALNE